VVAVSSEAKSPLPASPLRGRGWGESWIYGKHGKYFITTKTNKTILF